MGQKKLEIPSPSVSTHSEFTIGALLIQKGKLSAQNADIVMRSLKTDGMRFGDVAKSLGLITEADIQEVVSKQFDYPYVINGNEFSPDLIAAYEPSSPQAEFLKGLRTQLSLGWFKDHKVLAISSIDKGNGSSRFAANLAITFSQVGKKTLLIDSNLRSPMQSELFKIDYQRGLSDILIGRAGLEVIFRVDSLDKLSILPAGTLPPNPQEIVSGNNFKELMGFLNEIFDVILIDTPAFAVGADAQAISAAVGGTLLVARKHITRATQMSKVASMLVKNGSQVVGSVITDF